MITVVVIVHAGQMRILAGFFVPKQFCSKFALAKESNHENS